MDVTRRTLAQTLATMALIQFDAEAQTPAANPDADLAAARDQLRANSLQIARVSVPMATEPAFRFRA